MDFYIYFPDEGNPQRLMVPQGEVLHTQHFLNGPKAPSYEQYPIRMYEWPDENGKRRVFLIAYANEPTEDVIDEAIVRLKLLPTTNYQDDDEDE